MRMSEYRDELALLADEHGITESQRAVFMLGIACAWLEAKDRHLEATRGLGLARRGAPGQQGPGVAGEPQRVAALRGRESHSHAERGAR